MGKFDDILAEINDFGRYQKIRYFLIWLAGLLPPIATYIHTFLAANPDHSCKATDSTIQEIKSEKCAYFINGTRFKCDAWNFDKKYYQSTLTEEWEMVCENTFLRANVQTVYFCGYLVGSLLLGSLADIFGRRPIMLSSFILIILGSIGSALGPQKSLGFTASYIIYALSRFTMAVGTRGINETGYVLALELVGQSRRTLTAILFEHSFSVGQLVLVVAAYFIRDWRVLALSFVVPCIPFLFYFFILPESPRWLISKNRKEEAYEILENVAKTNRTKMNIELWNDFLDEANSKKQEKPENLLTLIKSLIKYPNLFILLVTMATNWLIANFVFYGVGLKGNDLGVNPYLSFAISAIVELFSYTTTLFVIDKFGRKKPYFTFLLCAGCSLFTIVFIKDRTAILILAMIGKFSISASYAILRLYSNEVFPTSIRNSCMGSCSMISRMGVIVAPIINSLGDRHWESLPFMIFGILATMAAFSTILLPETLHKNLPENLNEANKLNSYSFKKKKSNKHELVVITNLNEAPATKETCN